LCIIFLQAIYKDVNIVHLIYFFFNTVFNSCPFFFSVHDGFDLNPFHRISLYREVMSDSSEIFCHC
uniref:Uncharacterized protein n=1 Tax=Melopsittacus undulatus TaxID=13146 RepID=A0A8V5G5U6_MELUD